MPITGTLVSMQARHRTHDRCRFPQMTGPEQLSAYCWLSRDVSAIAAGMEINLSGWQLLALSGQSRHRCCCSGQSGGDPALVLRAIFLLRCRLYPFHIDAFRAAQTFVRCYSNSGQNVAPVSRPVQWTGSIKSHPILGGLHCDYVRI